MFGFDSPWWLLGLALIPLIRWLHRWQAPLSRVSVSALFLWDRVKASAAGGAERRPPESAWWRRALIALLAVSALAAPWRQTTVQQLTVWIDDSLSMATIEQGRTRLENGLELLQSALNDMSDTDITLRSLSDATLAFNTASDIDVDAWLSNGPGHASPPAPALLSDDSAHWLVTDGADPRVRDWATRAPLQRIVQVGAETENAAVTRLAARRSVVDAAQQDVLIEVSNRGTVAVTRELLLRDRNGTRVVAAIELAPGETRQVTTASSSGNWLAELQPSDALALDDRLLLDKSVFEPVITAVDAECTQPLQRALAAHPGLRVTTEDISELYVACSDRALYPPRGLRFYAGNSQAITGNPTWLPGADALHDIALARGWLFASPWPTGQPADAEVLLAAGDNALIVSRNGGALIESVIDMSDSALAGQPEYAALVAGLVDAALDRTVLDPVAAASRDPDSSTIAPVSIAGIAAINTATSAEHAGISNVFILLVLLVLGVDVVLIATTRRRARREQD